MATHKREIDALKNVLSVLGGSFETKLPCAQPMCATCFCEVEAKVTSIGGEWRRMTS